MPKLTPHHAANREVRVDPVCAQQPTGSAERRRSGTAAVRPLESALRRIPIVSTQACRDNGFSPQFYARLGGPLYLFIGELSFALWLTVKSVNVARWQEMTEHSTASL